MIYPTHFKSDAVSGFFSLPPNHLRLSYWVFFRQAFRTYAHTRAMRSLKAIILAALAITNVMAIPLSPSFLTSGEETNQIEVSLADLGVAVTSIPLLNNRSSWANACETVVSVSEVPLRYDDCVMY